MKMLEFTDKGIYCREGGFHIDPWGKVKTALITHAHSDHARVGSDLYIAHHYSVPILRYRLGEINIKAVEYGEVMMINGIKVSFHPAGHVQGSAQINLEYKGEVWVASGDYKLQNDNLNAPFEPIKCHTFITESTFGLPIYKWPDQSQIFNDINAWWKSNAEQGISSVILGYPLGKTQRILKNIDPSIGKVFTHGAVENINKLTRQFAELPHSQKVTAETNKKDFATSLIIAPPSASGSSWLKRFYPYSISIASGWMALRGARRRKAVDRGFALSDHADWNELITAVKETGAGRVYVTHGYTAAFSRYLNEKGYEAYEAKTAYEGELEEINEGTAPEEKEES